MTAFSQWTLWLLWAAFLFAQMIWKLISFTREAKRSWAFLPARLPSLSAPELCKYSNILCFISTWIFTFINAFRAKLEKRKKPPVSFYLDLNMLGLYWNCFPKKGGRIYHHTGPVNSIYGLREGLAILAEEGLENCWRRHRLCADRLHEGQFQRSRLFLSGYIYMNYD